MRYLMILISSFASILLATQPALASYIPEEGDIIFHTSTSNLSTAIQAVTRSPYSHMGIVLFKDGKPHVLEAVGPVKYTHLDQWISRGIGGQFVVKRLKTALSQSEKQQLHEAAKSYIGKPYDIRFEWSNKKIYCSELVWKVYLDALAIKLAPVSKLGSYDLTDPIVAKTVKKIYGNNIPLKETVIAPVAIYESPLLQKVTVD